MNVDISKHFANKVVRFFSVNLLEEPKCSFEFKITRGNFKRACLSNGNIFFSKRYPYMFCCKNKDGGIIVLNITDVKKSTAEQITEEDKPFFSYGFDL